MIQRPCSLKIGGDSRVWCLSDPGQATLSFRTQFPPVNVGSLWNTQHHALRVLQLGPPTNPCTTCSASSLWPDTEIGENILLSPPQTAFPGAHSQVISLLKGRLTSGVPVSIWKCSAGGKSLCYKASMWAMFRGFVTQPHTVTTSPEFFAQKPLRQPALCILQSHRTELFSRC